MPLVFVHGVNTRDTDPDYFVTKEARRAQFRDLVGASLRNRFPQFDVLDDIYWGDLGVQFRWNLASIPDTKVLQSLGPEQGAFDNPALLEFIAQNGPAAGTAAAQGAGLERLGSPAQSTVLLQSFRTSSQTGRAGDIVRRVFAPEAERFDPVVPVQADREPDHSEGEAAGEQLAILYRAAEQVARDVDAKPDLLAASQNDDDLLSTIERLVFEKYGDLLSAAVDAGERGASTEPRVEHLGPTFDKAKQFAVNKLHQLVEGAKSVVTTVQDTSARAATLLAFDSLRDQVSRKGLRFFGDVFVYLHTGLAGEIIQRVSTGVLSAWKIAKQNNEPLVVVTHSFGSELLYEGLTGAVAGMNEVEVRLWVSAGAQTSLFAEMALYASSDKTLPSAARAVLGKPAQVKKWINFFDAADALSFLHKPVFGDVTDIEVREGANLKTAHGHYFLATSFYERVLAEIPV